MMGKNQIKAKNNMKCFSREWRESEALLIIVVTIGAFLDSMLVSIIVPILPYHLHQMHLAGHSRHNETKAMSNSSGTAEQMATLFANLTTTEGSFQLSTESVELGVLFASKPFVQLLFNPLVGRYANKYSYGKMMSFGFAMMFSSTLLFALGVNYSVLLFARSLQGIASSFASVVGITALADRFTDEKKRGNAIRIALAGLGIGLSVGPPFGGSTYTYFGKTSPFLIMCGLIFIDTCLLALIAQPTSVRKKKHMKQTAFFKLMCDPYIMIVAGGVFLSCGSYAIIEATLPLYMIETMKSKSLELGMVFVPYSVSFLIITALIGNFCLKIPRWLLSMTGIIVTGISLIMYPFCKNLVQILIPSAIMGLGAGIIDIALMPEVARLVDLRHTSMYGNAFAIVDIAICVGLAVGPLFAGLLLKYFNFTGIMVGGSIICFIYVPLIYLLRNPPTTAPTLPAKELRTIDIIVESAKENNPS